MNNIKNPLFFINRSLWSNKFFIFSSIFCSSLFITLNILFNIKINYSDSKNFVFNQLSVFYIIVFILFSLFFISNLSFYLFSSFRKNGLQIILQTHNISRRKIIFSKLLILGIYYSIYSLFNLILTTIISVIFNNNQLVILSLILIVSSLLIFFIFFPMFLFINTYLKGNLSIIAITLLIFFTILSFFGFRLLGAKRNSDILNYEYNVSKNNYFKIYDVDKNGNIKKQYLGIKRNNKNNLVKNLNNDFINNVNKTNDFIFNFSLGEMLVAIPSQIYNFDNDLFQDANKISRSNHMFNTKLIDTSYENDGSPSSISKISNPVVVSFQDQNPFEMKYEEFQKNVFEFLDQLNINKQKDQILINSLIGKIRNQNYYNLENNTFSLFEKNLLKKLGGISNPFLYYYLKYKTFFNNKYSSIFKSIKEKYPLWVYELIEKTWSNDLFIKNLVSYKTIINPSDMENKFPGLKILNNLENISQKDENYFKNILIHFDPSNNAKILEQTNSGTVYRTIDLKKVDASIVDKNSWDKYIDGNLEIVNANNIYQNLKLLNSKIPNKYVFDNNQIDIYSYDGLLKLKNKDWINNLYIHYLFLILISSICLFISIRKISRKEDTYEN